MREDGAIDMPCAISLRYAMVIMFATFITAMPLKAYQHGSMPLRQLMLILQQFAARYAAITLLPAYFCRHAAVTPLSFHAIRDNGQPRVVASFAQQRIMARYARRGEMLTIAAHCRGRH